MLLPSHLISALKNIPKLCLRPSHSPAAGYTHERYREIINSIRRYMPDASVSGDAIVGFPGETEEQFERTMALVEEVGFDRVNTGGRCMGARHGGVGCREWLLGAVKRAWPAASYGQGSSTPSPTTH